MAGSQLHTERHLVIVLGATGDLMRRKLLPVLANLTEGGAACYILAAARSKELNDNTYRNQAGEALVQFGKRDKAGAAGWAKQNLAYASIGAGSAADFRAL